MENLSKSRMKRSDAIDGSLHISILNCVIFKVMYYSSSSSSSLIIGRRIKCHSKTTTEPNGVLNNFDMTDILKEILHLTWISIFNLDVCIFVNLQIFMNKT